MPQSAVESYLSGELGGDEQILWIVGGGEIYKELLGSCDEVELTLVTGNHEGDAFFPQFEDEFDLVDELPRDGYSFLTYRRKPAA